MQASCILSRRSHCAVSFQCEPSCRGRSADKAIPDPVKGPIKSARDNDQPGPRLIISKKKGDHHERQEEKLSKVRLFYLHGNRWLGFENSVKGPHPARLLKLDLGVMSFDLELVSTGLTRSQS